MCRLLSGWKCWTQCRRNWTTSQKNQIQRNANYHNGCVLYHNGCVLWHSGRPRPVIGRVFSPLPFRGYSIINPCFHSFSSFCPLLPFLFSQIGCLIQLRELHCSGTVCCPSYFLCISSPENVSVAVHFILLRLNTIWTLKQMWLFVNTYCVLQFETCFWVPFLKQLLLRNGVVDFVEICNAYIGKMIMKVAKRIFNFDKICRSYSDLNFGVTFLEHSV